MALVRTFEKVSPQRENIHEAVNCKYFAFERDGKHYFQICTSGSEDRKMIGKTSQTIQFDNESAGLLFALLKLEFSLT